MPVDPNLGARFYIHPVLQSDESKNAGRPIYKDAIYVEIFIKGMKNSTFSRPMKNEDKEDFPVAWRSFKEKDEDLIEGTPIRVLPGMGPSAELEFKALGIKTVEDMAELSEQALDNIRGGRNLKKQAKAYLAASQVEIEPVEQQEDEPVDVEALKNDPTVIRKPGRPRKQVA